MTGRLVIAEVGTSARNETTRSMPAIIMDRLHPEKKSPSPPPPFVCRQLRVGIKRETPETCGGGGEIFLNTESRFRNFKA